MTAALKLSDAQWRCLQEHVGHDYDGDYSPNGIRTFHRVQRQLAALDLVRWERTGPQREDQCCRITQSGRDALARRST